MKFQWDGAWKDSDAAVIGVCFLIIIIVLAGLLWSFTNRGRLDRYVAARSLKKNIDDSNTQLQSLMGNIEALLEQYRKNPENLPENLEELKRNTAYVKWDKESVSRFSNTLPHSLFHGAPDIYCRVLCNANNFYDFYESYKQIYFTFMDKLNADITEYCKSIPYEGNSTRQAFDALTTATIKLDAEKAMRIYEKILRSLQTECDKANDLIHDLDKLILKNG